MCRNNKNHFQAAHLWMQIETNCAIRYNERRVLPRRATIARKTAPRTVHTSSPYYTPLRHFYIPRDSR